MESEWEKYKEETFNYHDADKDGTLDIHEVTELIRGLDLTVTTHQVLRWVRQTTGASGREQDLRIKPEQLEDLIATAHNDEVNKKVRDGRIREVKQAVMEAFELFDTELNGYKTGFVTVADIATVLSEQDLGEPLDEGEMAEFFKLIQRSKKHAGDGADVSEADSEHFDYGVFVDTILFPGVE